ncbi:hypothetical protein D7Z54_32485 [Salibacterium salarium]|uniref:Sporulation lipoprotein YhcN/YlaJ (Spore_YhcN_YlaJ) n=1 Tax=Salibacterium salarium TaxID=284579 RepID=A0A3R9NYY4_9BACI|nr:YhcN/YlaJ family sporulation lipoprotein [Salibacterium salarium]RSL29206.1 hypothetical protein D7Z54_32485 [Salibacterium salarium]
MKKAAMTITACAIIAGGLTGCGEANDGNEGAAPTRTNYNDYDQNEGRYNNVRDNGRMNQRGEGPATDMMTEDDRPQGGVTGRRPANDNRGQVGDRPGMVGDRGTLNTEDVNDGGAMNNANGNNGNNGNGMNNNGNNGGNGNGSTGKAGNVEEIENKVENMDGVDDARAIVRGNDILVGIDTPEEDEQAQKLTDKVKEKVNATVDDDREIYVTFDEEQFGNIQEIGDDIQDGTGEGLNEAGDTINQMIEDIGNAAQRPFENS